MILRALLTTGLALFAPDTVPADDPLAGLIEQPIDIELRGAPIRDVFLLVQDLAQVDIDLDPCVQGTVDIALERVTVRTLMEAMADALALEYGHGVGDAIAVGCAGRDSGSRALSIEVRDAAIDDIVKIVMPSAQVSGCEGHRIDLEVRNASPAAIMAGLAGELPAKLWVEGGALHLRCE